MVSRFSCFLSLCLWLFATACGPGINLDKSNGGMGSNIDTQPPTVGALLPPSNISGTELTLRWTVATDDLTSQDSLKYLVCTSSLPTLISDVNGCLSANIALDWTANATTVFLSGQNLSVVRYYNVLVKDLSGNQAIYSSLAPTTLEAFSFDGTNIYDYGNPNPNETKALFATWVKANSPLDNDRVIFTNSNDGTSSGITLRQSAVSPGKVELLIGLDSSTSYSTSVLADSPIGYWRLGETSGTTAVDSSGNGQNGTYTGGYTLGITGPIVGESSKGVRFDGSSGYIQTPLLQNAVTSYSTEAWVKSVSQGMIVDDRGYDESEGLGAGLSITMGVGWRAAAGKPFIVLNSNYISIGLLSTVNVNNGAWHHLVGTWTAASGTLVHSSQFKLYIDGVDVTDSATADNFIATDPPRSPLTGLNGTLIGGLSDFEYIDGTLDEVAVYPSALSAAQVATHYVAGKKSGYGRCQSTTSLVAGVWSLIGGIFDGSTLQLFVNGNLECSVSTTARLMQPNNNLILGGTSTKTHSWSGYISNIRLKGTSDGSSPGTTSEIQSFYNATSPYYTP